MSDLARRRFSVGYALAQKKVQSFIQPSLVDYARERGVDLIPLDASKPLVDQGSFDCIIHKLYDQEWKKNLINFSSTYPYVPVIDHPDAIERLRDRTTMLQVVDELQLHSHDHSVSIPKQIVVDDWELFSDPNTFTLQGLTFPLIAKPLIADGSANSHQMSLLFNSDGIKELKLKPPVVFQEFVNHGGVIFKVYVVGEYVQCVKRRSLPDVSAEKMGNSEGLLSFSQISNLAREDQDDCDHTSHIEEAKMPPLNFINDIANALRQATTLHLFNFDMIRDKNAANRYLIIDINYFPGYAKLPSYESLLTDFFLGVAQNKQAEGRCTELKERQGSGSEDDKQLV